MKQFFFIFILVFCITITSKAQGTLQFKQVKLIDSTEEIVPEGKVWKVVSVAGTRVIQHDQSHSVLSAPSQIAPPESSILINGNLIHVGNPNVGAGGGFGTGGSARSSFNSMYVDVPTSFPLWLPENTSLQASENIKYISVIEFIVNE